MVFSTKDRKLKKVRAVLSFSFTSNYSKTKLHGRGHNSLHEDFEIKQHW